MKIKIGILVAVIALAGALVYYYTRTTQPGAGAFRDHNVVLITVDTLRADHLPAYGYTKGKTPAIDQFAAESLIFEDAVAHSPMTLPSHASILTGMLPIAHGIRDNAGFILSSDVTTLAEILKSNGYSTGAFISAFVLDSQFGLNQGFDVYSDSFTLARPRVNNTDTQRRAEQTQAEVDLWLQQAKNQKFFLWVHYYDPHDPYEPPGPFDTGLAPYDGEISYTDHVIGKLLRSIEPVKEKTIVMLAGDHGESLGEHEEQTHSLFIYSATQHVPLLIGIPGGKTRRLEGTAALIDIAPTILDWLGIQPPGEMQGKSLIPMVQGKDSGSRRVYSESLFAELHYGWSPLKSITTPEYKFIEAPRPELYDRKADRRETHNIINDKPNVAAELRKQLVEIESTGSKQTNIAAKIDPETEEKLRSLGYVGTIVPGTPQSRKIDPKDKILLLQKLSLARKAMDKKDHRTALQIAEQVLVEDPGMIDAHFIVSTSHLHLGNKEQAIAAMKETIRLHPGHTQTLYNLGFFHQIEGDLKAAEKWYLQLLQYEPEHLVAHLNLLRLYRQSDQRKQAQETLTRVLELYKAASGSTQAPQSRSELLETMAEIYFKIGDVKQSEAFIKEAITLTPSRPMLHFHLGVIFEAQENPAASQQKFRDALRLLEGRPLNSEEKQLRDALIARTSGGKG